jgi:hypothetical protein
LHPSDDDSVGVLGGFACTLRTTTQTRTTFWYRIQDRCGAGVTRGVVYTVQEAFDELRLQSDGIQGVDHRLDHRSMSFDAIRCMCRCPA